MMTTRHLIAVMTLAVSTLSSPLAAQPAAPEGQPPPTTPEGQAQVLFDESRHLYTELKYEEAIAKLKEAYQLVPSAALLYNTAKCFERMGDYPNAIDYYERYLKAAVGAPDADTVRDLVTRFRSKLSKSATPASPDERAAAVALKGRDYYRAGRYTDAIAQLERASKIVEKSAFVYNIAKCYEKMGEYDQAVVYYQRYLELEPEASDRGDVQEIIKALEKRLRESLSELNVRTVPATADIYIDDMTKLLGQTPLEVRLAPGKHKIVIQKNGYEPVEREFEMPEDRPRDLAYPLVKVKNFGGLAIDSNVNGAQIFLDGKILALTPYNITKLVEQGTHQVTVRRDGYYLYQADVAIEKGKLTKVQADLPERGKLTGWMTTVGGWVLGVSGAAGLLTTVTAAWLGSHTIQGTPLSENAWIVQQIGMYGGLTGVLVGATFIVLDLVIQPEDVMERIDAPSAALPPELIGKDDEAEGGAL